MNIKWGVRSILGLALVVLAALSLILDVAGIVQVWALREPVTQDAINSLDLLNTTLDTTSQGLVIAKTSLQSVTTTIGVLQTTVSSAAATLNSASGSVSSLSGIVGQNLTATVSSALTTLGVVETTTKTLDDFLGSISKLPLVNLSYNPDQPLSASINALTDQLKQVPQSLGDLETNLKSSGTNLTQVSNDANTLSASLGQVQSDMSKLVGVIDQYQQQVSAFQGTVRNLRENIVTIVWGLVLFITFMLFWLGATMIMTLFKGLEWMGFHYKLPK